MCGMAELWCSGGVAGDRNEKGSPCVDAVRLAGVGANTESCRRTAGEQCCQSGAVSADRQDGKGGVGVRNGVPRYSGRENFDAAACIAKCITECITECTTKRAAKRVVDSAANRAGKQIGKARQIPD